MTMFAATKLIATISLVLIHIFVGRLHFLNANSVKWKSAAAGVGISYAFLVLLPKLARAQAVLESASDSGIYGFLVHHSYILALLGLIIYYGMDAYVSNVKVRAAGRPLQPAARVIVAMHAAAVSGYYFLVSYLMSELRQRGYVGYVSLGLFATAMILHYTTIDHGLRQKFGALYHSFLRWAFAGASAGGWLAATIIDIPYTAMALLNSLFAGALIVFTLQEKTPGADSVRFRWFLCGVVGYSLLLIAIEFLAIEA